MTLVRLGFSHCGLRLLLVLPAVALVAALLAGRGTAPGDDAAAVGWLHLPLFAAVLTAGATAIECWPLFARARPGAGWIERLQPGPWRGCGAVLLGALLAAAAGCGVVGAAAPLLVGALPAPRLHVELQTGSVPVLAGARGELVFALPAGHRYAAVLLRPLAYLPAAELQPTTLWLDGDAGHLHATPVEVEDSGQLLRVEFAPLELQQLRLRRAGGNVPLAFPPGGVVAVAAEAHSRLANAIAAAGSYLLPLFTALAVAVLAARSLALPLQQLLLTLLLVALTLGGLSPTGEAVAALMRGRWLGDGGLFRAAVPSLGAGVVAMIVAMLLPRRRP